MCCDNCMRWLKDEPYTASNFSHAVATRGSMQRCTIKLLILVAHFLFDSVTLRAVMKTLVSVTWVLVLFTLTEALDPKYFKCYPNSPTNGDVFSDGDPPVNLVHIFCGQINKYGQATGFHSHPNGKNPKSAAAFDPVKASLSPNPHSYTQYKNIYVRLNWNTWLQKLASPTTFWPTSMRKRDVVSTIQWLYSKCRPLNQNAYRAVVCIENYYYHSQKFAVKIVLENKTVKTAYPVKSGSCPPTSPKTNTRRCDIGYKYRPWR